MNRVVFMWGLFCLILSFTEETFASPSSHLRVTGHFGEASRIYNCLAYQKCDVIQTSIHIPNSDPSDWQLDLFLSRDPSEIESQLSRCDLTAFKGQLQIIATSGKIQPLVWKPDLKPLDLEPALLFKPESNPQAWMPELKKRIEQKDLKGAFSWVMQKTHWSAEDYKFVVNQKEKKYAFTFHDRKKIKFPGSFDFTPCQFVRMLRHELEHIQQVKFENQCATFHQKSSFQDHIERERAAHFSDVAEAELYCPTDIFFVLFHSKEEIEKKYLHPSGD